VNGSEMPGMDGSSEPFVRALSEAGLVRQGAPRPYLIVTDVTRVGNDESWIEARPSRQMAMSIQYRLELRITLTPQRFIDELAPARTFILQKEAEWLRQQGLAQRVTCGELLVIGEDGVIDNEFRFPNECVAHKLLDMVGDLSLAGCDLLGQFVAHRSGHRLNAQLIQVLLSEFQVIRDWRASA
jgi:UDP-3-O-acyl-N-acetylglucosamine deacetylase